MSKFIEPSQEQLIDRQQSINRHLDRMRDEFRYSVYKCRDCNFRAFGAPVMVHEYQLKHTMEKEIPLTK